MAYTAQTPRSLATQQFGPLGNDANRNALTGAVGNTIYTRDATGTPQNSPLTVNTTATLVVPTNAIQCTIVSTTNAVQVSEDSTSTASFALPAGVPWTFDCARMSDIYLKTGSSTAVNFYFTLL